MSIFLKSSWGICSIRSAFSVAFGVVLLGTYISETTAQQPLAPVRSRSTAAPTNLPARTQTSRTYKVRKAQIRPTRDALFAALAQDVRSLEKELGIFRRAVKLAQPTVVHIEAQPVPTFKRGTDFEEAGSGVLVRFNNRDYVLTNRHVIRHSSAALIKIQLHDGRVIRPTQVITDPETDIAVLRINEPRLIPARFGNSDELEIGDQVLAMGSPFGLSQSVTRGIISAKGRYNLDLGDGEVNLQNFLQTDAAINPGNSGGPLINLRGEVIGLNTAIASNSGGNEGIGFSIPINVVHRIAKQLVSTGKVTRGFLGVSLAHQFTPSQARTLGLPRLVGTRISSITPNSPASLADLRVDDVVLKFNGVRVEDDGHLISLVKLTEVGKQVDLLLFRSGKPLRTRIEVGDLTNALK